MAEIFLLDSVTRMFAASAFEPSGLWTKDRPPQPCWTPVYEGGEVNEETGEVTGGTWADPGKPAEPTAEELAEQERSVQLAAIAARRYQAETGGFEFNGFTINTEDRSKLLIDGAALEATLDPEYTLRWKTPSGFVGLNAGQVIVVARAVRAHVQACFDREDVLMAEVEAGTYSEEMLEEGWPA